MRKNILSILLLTASIIGIESCNKQYSTIATYQVGDSVTSFLKVVHIAPNFRKVTNLQDTFNVYVNSARITSPALSFTPGTAFVSIFPAITLNNYSAIPAGTQTIRLSIPGTVNPDSITAVTMTKSFVQGLYYTLFITDSINSATDANRIFVQDNFTAASTGYYNLRFCNAVFNDSATISTGTKTVDIFSYARNATIFNKVRADSTTTFQVFGTNVSVADTLYVTRTPASGTPPLSSRVILAKLALVPGYRTYTLYYKGDGTATTGTKARTLGYYVNQ